MNTATAAGTLVIMACAAPPPPRAQSRSDRELARDMEFAPYRSQTVTLLRRYFNASLQVGRMPQILGREVFRARTSHRKVLGLEDLMIFTHDFERFLARLQQQEKELIATLIFKEHSQDQVAQITGLTRFWVRARYFRAIDAVTQMSLAGGYLRAIPGHEAAENLVKSKKIPHRS